MDSYKLFFFGIENELRWFIFERIPGGWLVNEWEKSRVLFDFYCNIRPGNTGINVFFLIRNVSSPPQRPSKSRESDYHIPDSNHNGAGGDVWSSQNSSVNGSRLTTGTGTMASSGSGRTPSPRSPAVSHHDVPMGSLRRSGGETNRRLLYENSAIAESESVFLNHDMIESSPSTSFTRGSGGKNGPPVPPLPWRQASFDHNRSYGDHNGGDSAALKHRFSASGRKENSMYQNPVTPTGIRSVEGTPRVQRRANNGEAALPQINEIGGGGSSGVTMMAGPQIVRQHQEAFVISGGTPMQSRKKRSTTGTKTNGSNLAPPAPPSSASPQCSRLPTPSTPSGMSQSNEVYATINFLWVFEFRFDWLIDPMIDRLIDWLTDWFCYCR